MTPAGRVVVGIAEYAPEEIPAAIRRYERLLEKAERDSKKAAEARGNLPPGSTRARITTANARWWTAAEHRDTIREHLEALRAHMNPSEAA